VNAAFNQYPRNTFSSTDCLAVDCLAKELGIEVTSADHALKAYMQRGMVRGRERDRERERASERKRENEKSRNALKEEALLLLSRLTPCL
jgi:hypothetical protein